MNSKVGIGVIGTGFAQTTQIPGFTAVTDAEVVSVASARMDHASSAAEKFAIPHFTDDWRETIRRDDVDLVCISTPPALHRLMTLDALKNGKHVLCEKPMAMNLNEAFEMAAAARDSGLLAVIDHELRFTRGRQKARSMIHEGRIGNIRHARYLFRNSARGDFNLPWTWWSDIEQGGGALGAIGSHVIDTFRWFLETEIQDVHCRLNTHVDRRPIGGTLHQVTSDDEFLMTLGFCNTPLLEKATASVTASMVEAGPYRNRVEFFGTKGAIRIEDGGEVFVAESSRPVWEQDEFELGKVAKGMKTGGWSRGFTSLSEIIVETIQKGETTFENAPTFDDGCAIQKVLDAARKSDAYGSIVEVSG